MAIVGLCAISDSRADEERVNVVDLSWSSAKVETVLPFDSTSETSGGAGPAISHLDPDDEAAGMSS